MRRQQPSNSVEAAAVTNVIRTIRRTSNQRISYHTVLLASALIILVQTIKVTLDYSSKRSLTFQADKDNKKKMVNIGEREQLILPTIIDDATNTSLTTAASATSQEDFLCTWSPGNDEECVNHLIDRITQGQEGKGIKNQQNHSQQRFVFKRWVLTGDSTMWRLFMYSPIKKRLSKRPCWTWGCQWKGQTQGGPCDEFANIMGVQKPTWKPPNHHFQKQQNHHTSSATSLLGRKEKPKSTETVLEHNLAEGPVTYGLKNPYCTDCSGCSTYIVFCQRKEDDPPPPCNITHPDYSIGAYFPIEFARDVEIQSTLYPTTQENFAHYLNEQWNIPYMVRQMGRPVCLIQNGIHDVAIPNITIQKYLHNVQTYVNLMIHQCSHIIWLGNTSPKTENYVQKYSQTRDWNMAVLDMLRQRVDDMKFSFVDVFDSSRNATHVDNIHMDDGWYENLGGMFSQVIAKLAAI